jgi:cytochrome c5
LQQTEMSTHETDTAKKILGGIFAGLASFAVPVLLIFLTVELVLNIQAGKIDPNNPAFSEEAVDARIWPVAQVNVMDANAPKVDKSGKEVFDSACAACHGTGAMGAPRAGNKADWGARIAQGYNTLLKHALNGIRQMPARGGSADLSDLEIARALVYMVNQSGAGFAEPKASPSAPAARKTVTVSEATTRIPAANSAKIDGKAVYDSTCVACHASGAAGAPRTGDKVAWAARLQTGMNNLYRNALKGKNVMPPKGGNLGLSDAEVKAAVDYLVNQAK